uniref:Uncharacterized protein n=1 Tax=Glossina austeni TaxID=7395 RepID=A0A1A9V0P8_GLOAU
MPTYNNVNIVTSLQQYNNDNDNITTTTVNSTTTTPSALLNQPLLQANVAKHALPSLVASPALSYKITVLIEKATNKVSEQQQQMQSQQQTAPQHKGLSSSKKHIHKVMKYCTLKEISTANYARIGIAPSTTSNSSLTTTKSSAARTAYPNNHNHAVPRIMLNSHNDGITTTTTNSTKTTITATTNNGQANRNEHNKISSTVYGQQRYRKSRSPTSKGLSTNSTPIVADVDTTRTSLANGAASQRRKTRGTRALKGTTTPANDPTLRCRKAEDNRAAVGHSTNWRRVPCPMALHYRKTIAPCSAQVTGSAPLQHNSTLLCSDNTLCAITKQQHPALPKQQALRPYFGAQLQKQAATQHSSGISKDPVTNNNTSHTEADTERPHRRGAPAVTSSPRRTEDL